jgi:hypothetical protein
MRPGREERIMRKLATALAAAAAISVAALPATSSAQETKATGGADAGFAQQAEDAGLTAREAAKLQHRVDQEVARTDGTQVSLNKVLWGDGSGGTLLALPGERQARDVTQASESNAVLHDCEYENLCIYTGSNYGGDKYWMWDCKTYDVSDIYFESWVNNQTPGTTAYFWDSNGNLYLSTTAYDEDPYDPGAGTYTYSITNC